MERLIKYTDIHLRIRTLIAEAGREMRTATKTIEDGKACRFYGQSPFLDKSWDTPWGRPEVASVHVKTINCLRGIAIMNCRARSTLRAPFRMAVPPVLSSTSAEYSLQEVKGCTMFQPAWHATASVGYNGKGMEMH
jgi:hypothetical protein